MAVVLGVLVLVGLLVSIQIVRERTRESLVGAWQKQELPGWLALAGRAMVLEDLDGSGTLWEPGSRLEEWVVPSRRGVRASLGREGFEAIARTTPLGSDGWSTRAYPLRVVSTKAPPVLVLLDGGAQVLGGEARIDGDVLAPGGVFTMSPWSILPARPGAGHRGRLDTTAGSVRGWRPDTRLVEVWWDSMTSLPVGTGELRDPMPGSVWRRDRVVRLGRGVDWTGVTLVARSIVVSSGAKLRDCVLLARDSLVLDGSVIVDGGQFLSSESLRVDLRGRVEGRPLFGILLAKGGSAERGISVNAFQGVGDFVVLPRHDAVVDPSQGLRVARGIEASGLICATGAVDLSGADWTGTVVAGSLVAIVAGTRFGGALHDAHLHEERQPAAWPVLWRDLPMSRIVARPETPVGGEL